MRQLEFYQIGEEDVAYGTAATVFTGQPVDEFSVGMENEAAQQDKHTGEIDDVFVDVVAQTLLGTMVTQIWPDNTAVMLALAGLPRESDFDLKSFTMEFFDIAQAEYITQTGLKADSVEISASGDDPKLKFSYDLIGQKEVTRASFSKPSLPSTPSFEFHDGAFTIGGTLETNIEEFTISISNNLRPSPPKDASRNIKWLDAGRRQIEMSWVMRTDSTLASNYINLVRTRDRSLSFVAAFDYPGTGSPIDTLSLTLSTLVLQTAVRTGSVGDIQTLACTAIARKPAATDAIVAATT